ncbi:MAG: FxLYD domain-containing protein, partial [Anaerolinea sp.]|nr:FxLYD domain-containing protein [Anaerolinea sp.]
MIARRAFVQLLIAVLISARTAHAQNVESGLVARDIVVNQGVGSFGQPVQIAHGVLVNETDAAYASIQLTATVFDAADAVIGEGIGFLVDACGAGLPFDFALQP